MGRMEADRGQDREDKDVIRGEMRAAREAISGIEEDIQNEKVSWLWFNNCRIPGWRRLARRCMNYSKTCSVRGSARDKLTPGSENYRDLSVRVTY